MSCRSPGVPKAHGGLFLYVNPAATEGQTFSGVIQNACSPVAEGRPLEIRVIRSGNAQILPGGPMAAPAGGGRTTIEIIIHAKTELADGSTIDITRHGAEPPKIVVTHDKEKWEGTAGDLSKVPEKVRPEVEKLLRSTFDHMRFLATTGEGPAAFPVP